MENSIIDNNNFIVTNKICEIEIYDSNKIKKNNHEIIINNNNNNINNNNSFDKSNSINNSIKKCLKSSFNESMNENNLITLIIEPSGGYKNYFSIEIPNEIQHLINGEELYAEFIKKINNKRLPIYYQIILILMILSIILIIPIFFIVFIFSSRYAIGNLKIEEIISDYNSFLISKKLPILFRLLYNENNVVPGFYKISIEITFINE
ncbi:hypothetical protein ACTA71_002427 [Dictyostelium dimigraforme]